MWHQRHLHYFDQVVRAGSVRRAALDLNITPSALTRRIQDIEEELATELFERNTRGMRLTAAGEVFARFARSQFVEADRMRSQIEDLKGLRRGEVRIACSQAIAHDFLPRAIQSFRKLYPLVGFDVTVSDHEAAMERLFALEVDLVLIFRPSRLPGFRPIASVEQGIVVLMREGHPLASRDVIRLSECRSYPLALPAQAVGTRQLLQDAAIRNGFILTPAIQSNSFEFLRGCIRDTDAISFQMKIGALPRGNLGTGLVSRELDRRDAPFSELVLGQLRERNLPSATAAFAQQLATSLKAEA